MGPDGYIQDPSRPETLQTHLTWIQTRHIRDIASFDPFPYHRRMMKSVTISSI